MSHLNIFQLSITALVLSTSSQTILASSFNPLASTSSNQSINVTINGGNVLSGESAIQTRSNTVAVASQQGEEPSPSEHLSQASIFVDTPINGTTIASINSSFNTFASSTFNEPLFSRAAAISQSSIASQVAPATSSALNLDWKFSTFNLQAEPTSSFAFISDAIIIRQTLGTNSQQNIIGFYTFLENGKQTTGFVGNPEEIQAMEEWFANNMVQTGNSLGLIENSDSLNIDINLLESENDSLLVHVENYHTETSYEAPPAATNQVGNTAGHTYFEEEDRTYQLHWDADSRFLSFDKMPINTLINTQNQHNQNDPLSNGYIEIDPLYLLTHLDGRDYFLGGELRLYDEHDQLVFRASLPSIAFDDKLFESQGFNMFAPILNILEADPIASNWLQENFFSNITVDSSLLPVLFIGFDPLCIDSDLWNEDFDAPLTALLSFSDGHPSTHRTPSE